MAKRCQTPRTLLKNEKDFQGLFYKILEGTWDWIKSQFRVEGSKL